MQFEGQAFAVDPIRLAMRAGNGRVERSWSPRFFFLSLVCVNTSMHVSADLSMVLDVFCVPTRARCACVYECMRALVFMTCRYARTLTENSMPNAAKGGSDSFLRCNFRGGEGSLQHELFTWFLPAIERPLCDS